MRDLVRVDEDMGCGHIPVRISRFPVTSTNMCYWKLVTFY